MDCAEELWAWVGHNPLSAVGTGREGGQDFLDGFAPLDERDEGWGPAGLQRSRK